MELSLIRRAFPPTLSVGRKICTPKTLGCIGNNFVCEKKHINEFMGYQSRPSQGPRQAKVLQLTLHAPLKRPYDFQGPFTIILHFPQNALSSPSKCFGTLYFGHCGTFSSRDPPGPLCMDPQMDPKVDPGRLILENPCQKRALRCPLMDRIDTFSRQTSSIWTNLNLLPGLMSVGHSVTEK